MDNILPIINCLGLALGTLGALILAGSLDRFLLSLKNSVKGLETTIDMMLHPDTYNNNIVQFTGLDQHRKDGDDAYRRKTKSGLVLIGVSFFIQILVAILQQIGD